MPIEKSNHTISRPLSQLAGGAKHSPLPEPAALDDLRAKIRQIEQSQTPFPKNGADLVSPTCTTSPDHPEPSPHAKEQKAAKGHCNKGRCNKAHWSFDIPEIDQALRQNQLNPAALHEIKPATYQDSHAALGFALALAGRRLDCNPGCTTPLVPAPCDVRRIWHPLRTRTSPPHTKTGKLPDYRTRNRVGFFMGHGRGIKRQCQRSDTSARHHCHQHSRLCACSRHGTKTIQPTPARRLSLRAATNKTPAILLTHHDTPGINMAETRWRIARAESEAAPHLISAPGRAKWNIILERAPNGKSGLQWTLEWHHETYSFTSGYPIGQSSASNDKNRN